MKFKEVIEILGVPAEEVLELLDNIGVEANMETEIEAQVLKKLGKYYKTEIKAVKKPKVEVKKPADVEEKKIVEETKKETLVENKKQPSKDKKEIKVEEKKTGEVKATPIKKETVENKQAKPAQTPYKDQKPVNNEVKKEFKENKHNEIENEIDKELELASLYDEKYSDLTETKKTYSRIKNVKKSKSKNTGSRAVNAPVEKKEGEKILYYHEGLTVAQIADSLNDSIGSIVKKLVMLGYMVNATQVLEKEVVELLAEDAGYELKNEIETDITKFEQIDIVDDPSTLQERPPIVTIMGHVDHGKTTLLDTIRNSHITAREAGGITQHIGAYQVKKNGKLITFIDTPGHAAFTEMRARGAEVTDIVILVVAADDGVMPQTKEAIEHAKAAKVPIIVAVNKMDKPGANPDRIKQELVQYDLVSEDWGGKTIIVPISALTGKGVDELLEMILLVSEMEQYKANPNRLGMGTVIEARVDKGRGPIASLLVKNGTIKVGDPIVVGNTYGKIRAMQDENKVNLKSAGPSKAVEITGLVSVPNAGDRFMIFDDERVSRLIAEERNNRNTASELNDRAQVSLANLFDSLDGTNKELNLIIKGDVQGSIEALKGSLEKVSVEGVKINIVRGGVGTITETDISLAIASSAIIICFNIHPSSTMLDNAKQKGIEVRQYNIIYKLLEDIEAAMKGLLDPVFEEKVTGEAEVRETYKVSKIGTIAGCRVTNGVILRGSEVRLIRDSVVIYTGKLSSLKRFKDDVKEVKEGFDCGITIENFNDIKIGDVIEAYIMEKVQ